MRSACAQLLAPLPGEPGLAGLAALWALTGLAGDAGLSTDTGLAGDAGLFTETGLWVLTALAGEAGLLTDTELPTELISATGVAELSDATVVDVTVDVGAGVPGDRFTEAAEASDVDVGGITTGADSRGALFGASCNSTWPGVSAPVSLPASTNPPSPTPATVPTAAATFQLSFAVVFAGVVISIVLLRVRRGRSD